MFFWKKVCIFAAKILKKKAYMENFIYVLIVISILLFCYWAVKGFIKCKRYVELEKETEELEIYIRGVNSRLNNIIKTAGLYYTNWGSYQLSEVEKLVNDGLNVSIWIDMSGLNEKYKRLKRILDEKIEEIKNQINDIINEISYNEDNWVKDIDKFPKFFVALSVGGIKHTHYCYCDDMKFYHDTKELKGTVFSNLWATGRTLRFSPKDWGIRPMSQYEFDNIFLPDVLNNNEFKSIEEMRDYSRYLKIRFNLFVGNYEY